MLATLTPKEREAVKSGNIGLLKKHLEKSKECVIERLMSQKEDVRFLQGEAYVINELLKLL